MQLDQLIDLFTTGQAIAAGVGCTGGVCAAGFVAWWRKRPRVIARRARRTARQEG